MHFILMPYLVSDTNRTPKAQQMYIAVRIVYYDSDGSRTYYYTVGSVHFSFVFIPRARIMLTKDILNRKYSFFMN